MTQIGSSTPTYDANGNVTNDFLHTYSWDANGRPVTIDGVGVTYDALGRMVEQNRSGTYSQMAYSTTGEKLQIMSGQSYQKQFIQLVGGSQVVIPSTGTAYYAHPDWLGSTRLASTSSRTVAGDVAYAPFGEPYAASGSLFLSFTGMNQDTTANDYDFPAREYGIQGRWPSPDPAGIDAVDPADPQSWNRYAYVLNNPLGATDPTGLSDCPYNNCGSSVSVNVGGFFDAIEDFFEGLFGGGPPPEAPPAPHGGYGAGIDPYGTWNEQVPKGVQVFPSPIPGLRQLPGGSNCDWCVDSYTIQLNRITRIKKGSWLNPYLWWKIWSSTQSTNAKLAQNLGTDVPSPELMACLAKKNLPMGLYTASSQGTDWALGEVLGRVGLAGVKEAGPIAMTGTFVGSTIGCAKELTPGVGP